MLLRRARQENQRGGRERESGSGDAGCWARQRGATLWSGLAILAGGFPGCASSGGRLRKAALTLTDRALIANANRPDGFALPLAAVRQIGTADDAPGDGPVVVVRYGDGADARTFAIRPAPARRGRAAEAMGGLLAALAATGWSAPPTPAPIDLTRSWGDARAAGSENILWNGDVSAPAHPWGEPRACQAWLSTRSLFWSPRDGAGLCRLPLAALLDGAPATANDRAPLLVVGYRDPGGSRHDLILCFDRHASPDRNQRERGALLVGLRSRGVSLGAPPPPSRPWEPAPSGDEPHGDGVADVATEPRAGSWRALPSAPHVPTGEARTTLMHSRDCEAALLGELARVSAALAAPVGVAVGRDDAPPLGAALAELDGAATGGMPADEIARRRARLLALSEAATRLRGLLVLRDGGLVAGAALDQRRRAILQPLERHLCA